MLSAVASDVPAVVYEAIVLVEPALITREAFNANLAEREGALKMMNIAVSKRRDAWGSRDEASAYFDKRFPWQMWDSRVRALYVVSADRLARMWPSR